MAPWIPVLVTIVLGVTGLGLQALALAYFIGRMKENQAGQAALVEAFKAFTTKTLDALLLRMGAVDSVLSAAGADRAAIHQRLQGIERDTNGLQEDRQRFAAFEATTTAHQERTEAELGRILQALEGQQRQLANLALRAPGDVITLPATHKGGG
jgi:hypothetical protein